MWDEKRESERKGVPDDPRVGDGRSLTRVWLVWRWREGDEKGDQCGAAEKGERRAAGRRRAEIDPGADVGPPY